MIEPKVLLIGPALLGGGAEGRFARVACKVAGGGADVAALVLSADAQYQGRGQVFDLRWRGVLSYPRLIVYMARVISRERYDVVMGFGLFPNVVAILAVGISGTGTRVVIHEITRPLKMLERSGRLKRLLYRSLQRFVFTRADVMTANSNDGLSELRLICPGFDGPVERLENAIDLDALRALLESAGPPPVPLPARYIVCVARLDYMKRIDTVIDALKHAAGRVDVGLVVVGDGLARAALENQALSVGMSDKVVFTGKMANPLGIVRGAAALVSASEYEGCSNSMLEAMAIGTPVIASYCSSDIRDMERQGAALCFRVGDFVQLAEEVLMVLESESLAHSLRVSGFSYAAKHSITESIKKYDDVLIAASKGQH